MKTKNIFLCITLTLCLQPAYASIETATQQNQPQIRAPYTPPDKCPLTKPIVVSLVAGMYLLSYCPDAIMPLFVSLGTGCTLYQLKNKFEKYRCQG